MCGIVGVLSNHEAAPIMVEALKRLEYRGYDSAGIATINDAGEMARRRAVGKLVNLSDVLVHEPLAGKAGIGHTRWATHGAANLTNTHPHRAGRVTVVHNGIIENFQELRAELANRGISHQTETDTETVALLTEAYLEDGLAPRDAVEQTIARLEGAFALCFLFEGDGNMLIAARKGSPLAIGHGDGEVFVGSDAIALAPLTDQITYLEEGDWAVLTRDSVDIYDDAGNLANRPVQTIQIDTTSINKGGFKHYMAKEIAEQPTVIGDVLAHYTDGDTGSLDIAANIDFAKVDKIVMVACGTAYLACLTAKYWLEEVSRLPVEVDIASEFRYREPPIPARTVAILVSQSGETADTLAALRYLKQHASKVVSVVNVETSTMARESDLALPILAGPEISVASTKAFTCQLALMALIALKAALDRGSISPEDASEHVATLRRVPGLIAQILGNTEAMETASRAISGARDILYLGRGTMFPLALEGALKLKELSYIHAEGYAAGELKHGPIALVDKEVPVVVMAPKDDLYEKTISNMQEVCARGGKIVLISDKAGIEAAEDHTWQSITLPNSDAFIAPLLYALPAQLLAYHTAVARGTDVDQPRNLAKSVTVE